jgi:hypothetical protein
MRFDAYSASIRDVDFKQVYGTLSDQMGGILTKGPALRRFGSTVQIDVEGHTAGWVGFDGGNGLVYLEGKGQTTPQWAQAIRDLWPDHGCPRADVCTDYNEPGAFDALMGLVRDVKGPRVWGGFVALPDDPTEGKTWAAGKRGAPAYLRLYEKGKQPDHLMDGKPDWVRLEGEFRPHTALHKVAAARLSPMEFWGLTAWSKRVGEAVTQCQIERLEEIERKYSHDKTTLYLARTFRRFWEEQLADGVDVIRTFQDIWREDDRSVAAMKM